MAEIEVRRDDFVYRDTLFADLGGNKRHPRASVAELRDLLLPKRAQPMDQVGHWYEAQLLHYGLSRTKDKNTAKVRLISALTSGSLSVPSHITRLEEEMKKEFALAKRRANIAAKKESSSSSSTQNKKRKAEPSDRLSAAASTTKMSLTIGDIRVEIDHQGGSATSKRQKVASPSTTNVTKKLNATAMSTPSVSRSTAKATTAVKAVKAASRSVGNPGSTGCRKPQTAMRRGPPGTRPCLPQPDRAYQSYGQSPNDTDLEIDDAPPPYSSLGYDEAYEINERHSPLPQDGILVSGTYTITTDNHDEHCELTLVKDMLTDQFWAHFEAADHRGVLRIPDMSSVASEQMLAFNWRAQDLNTNQFRFRREQDGWIQFDGQGGVTGCWHDLLYDRDVGFQGLWVDEPDVEVEDLMDEWEQIVKYAYSR